jgi:phosphoribosylformylglycinamidine synthase
MELDLDLMHKAADFPPEVLAIAETQERFLLIAPKGLRSKILKIYNEDWDLPNVYEGARASVVGQVNMTERFVVKHKGKIVCNVPINHLTGGIKYQRIEKKRQLDVLEPDFEMPKDMNQVILKILRSPNIASREHVYRYYDTEVMGNTVIRPGEADAGLLAPIRDEKFGIALSVDSNPFYSKINPYWGGATAVAEAMRNVAAIGATPWALTDCLNFGNPEKPEAFWEFRESVRGLAESCKKIWLKGYVNQPVPIVSGNVSFYNESPEGTVDPSPIIACIGIIWDVRKAITMDLKGYGNKLFLIGPRFDEMGGSEYYRTIFGVSGSNVPIVRFDLERNMIHAVVDAVDQKLVKACHDISNGGLACTVAEMAMVRPAKFGVELNLDSVSEANIRTDKLLFSESSGFVIETSIEAETNLVNLLNSYGLEPIEIGFVTRKRQILIKRKGNAIIDLDLDEAKKGWTEGLVEALK